MTLCNNKAKRGRFRETVSLGGSIVIGLLLAVTPKCPLCWGLYFSACGAGTINLFSAQRWTAPILALLLVFNVGASFHYARLHKAYGPFLINLLGALVIAASITLGIPEATVPGIIVVLIGSTSGVYQVLRSGLRHCCPRQKAPAAIDTTKGQEIGSLTGTR